MEERFDDGYYHIRKDMLDYPDAVVYCTYSRRGPGKTYGLLLTTLLSMYMCINDTTSIELQVIPLI